MRRLLGGSLPAGVEIPSADALATELIDVLMRGIDKREDFTQRTQRTQSGRR
jgi:hypothetical protein